MQYKTFHIRWEKVSWEKIEIKNVTIDVIIDPLDKCGNEKEVSQGTKRNPDVLSYTCTKDPTEKIQVFGELICWTWLTCGRTGLTPAEIHVTAFSLFTWPKQP